MAEPVRKRPLSPIGDNWDFAAIPGHDAE